MPAMTDPGSSPAPEAPAPGPDPDPAPPRFVVEFPVSARLAAGMLRAYLVRRMGGWMIAAGLAAGFGLWGVFTPSIRVPSAFVLGLAVMLAVAWGRAWRRTIEDARRRAGEAVRFAFHDDALEWSARGSTARVAWSQLRRLDRTRAFWFLQFESVGQAVTLPAELVAEPLRHFLEARAATARARVG